MASKMQDLILNFNIDTYLNPYLPHNQFKRVPKPISRWFGYREQKSKDPPPIIVQLFAFLGTFIGLLCAGAIYKYAPGINQFNPPVIIASLGASAILEYNAIQTPLSQPRNAIVGHGICAVIGVAISKAFQGYSSFQEIKWVSAALACAIACMATGMTGTVHPPGGATAVLASATPEIVAMGWYFVPVILVGVLVMLGVALLVNNVARQYPVYWWTPQETGQAYQKKQKKKQNDEEQGKHEEEKQGEDDRDDDHGEDEEDDNSSAATLHQTISNDFQRGIIVSAEHLSLPADLQLSPEEASVLKLLQARLREHNHL